mgnify:CR=1 FL=1
MLSLKFKEGDRFWIGDQVFGVVAIMADDWVIIRHHNGGLVELGQDAGVQLYPEVWVACSKGQPEGPEIALSFNAPKTIPIDREEVKLDKQPGAVPEPKRNVTIVRRRKGLAS